MNDLSLDYFGTVKAGERCFHLRINGEVCRLASFRFHPKLSQRPLVFGGLLSVVLLLPASCQLLLVLAACRNRIYLHFCRIVGKNPVNLFSCFEVARRNE